MNRRLLRSSEFNKRALSPSKAPRTPPPTPHDGLSHVSALHLGGSSEVCRVLAASPPPRGALGPLACPAFPGPPTQGPDFMVPVPSEDSTGGCPGGLWSRAQSSERPAPTSGASPGEMQGAPAQKNQTAGPPAQGLRLKEGHTQRPCSQAPPTARRAGRGEVQSRTSPPPPACRRVRPPTQPRRPPTASGCPASDRWPSFFPGGPRPPGPRSQPPRGFPSVHREDPAGRAAAPAPHHEITPHTPAPFPVASFGPTPSRAARKHTAPTSPARRRPDRKGLQSRRDPVHAGKQKPGRPDTLFRLSSLPDHW